MDTILEIMKLGKELTPQALVTIGMLVIILLIPYLIKKLEALILKILADMKEVTEHKDRAYQVSLDKLIHHWSEEAREFKAELRTLVHR